MKIFYIIRIKNIFKFSFNGSQMIAKTKIKKNYRDTKGMTLF